MSAVERLDDQYRDDAPNLSGEAPSIEADLIEQPAKGRAKLRPLLALAPMWPVIAAGRHSPSSR